MSRDELVVLHYFTVELILKNGITKEISVDLTLDRLAEIGGQFKRDPDFMYEKIRREIEEGISVLKNEVRLSMNGTTTDNVCFVNGGMFDGRDVSCMHIYHIASLWDIDSCLAEQDLFTKNYKRR